VAAEEDLLTPRVAWPVPTTEAEVTEATAEQAVTAEQEIPETFLVQVAAAEADATLQLTPLQQAEPAGLDNLDNWLSTLSNNVKLSPQVITRRRSRDKIELRPR
jgi:hypothetical protein